jgi:hypothetical protein
MFLPMKLPSIPSLKMAALANVALGTLAFSSLHAQVPQMLNYQGRVAVDTVNFDGSGSFKFALVNTDGTTSYWSNDGTSTVGNEPATSVSLPVTKGLYSVLLGANMKPIPNTVFANPDVRLRVWFDDGINGLQLLTPDQRIAAVGYAMVASSVPDGAITSAKLAPGAVSNEQLASGLTLGGTTTGNFSGNLTGNSSTATSASNFTTSLAGDVTGTQRATVVGMVGGSTAANIHSAELLANATTTASTPNSIVKSDSSGNLLLAPLVPNSQQDQVSATGPGNLVLRDARGVFGKTSEGVDLWSMSFLNAHNTGGGELKIISRWRLYLETKEGLQFGYAGTARDRAFFYLHSGSASASDTMRQSKALMFNTATWNGYNNSKQSGFQAVPADVSGKVLVKLFEDATIANTGIASGTEMAEFASEGIYTAGTAPAFDLLADGATITQACSKYKTIQTASVTLTGNRTLVIADAQDGMRGVIYVTQDGTGTRTLTPTNGTALGLSTVAGATDRVTWEFDGTYFYWAVSQDADRSLAVLDDDAAVFLAATSIASDSTEGIAINTLFTRLKANKVWDEIVSAWPLVGGTSAQHAVDMKGARTATFGTGVTHDANGITGSETSTGWMNSTVNVSALGIKDSVGVYCYNRTANITEAGSIIGTYGANARFYTTRVSTNMFGHGPCSGTYNTASRPIGTDCRGHWLLQRPNATKVKLRFNASVTALSNTSVTAPTAPIWFLASNDSSNRAANPTNANLAFCAVVTGNLDDTKATAMFAAIDAFQVALGRANP